MCPMSCALLARNLHPSCFPPSRSPVPLPVCSRPPPPPPPGVSEEYLMLPKTGSRPSVYVLVEPLPLRRSSGRGERERVKGWKRKDAGGWGSSERERSGKEGKPAYSCGAWSYPCAHRLLADGKLRPRLSLLFLAWRELPPIVRYIAVLAANETVDAVLREQARARV